MARPRTAPLGGLEAEVLASLNATEMARRRFREIARIAGLIFQSHPGEQRSSRQLQASSSLYYDVFAQYDPDNPLLAQARAELLVQELDMDRLAQTLQRMKGQQLSVHTLERPTPFALPLMVERFRERLSTESLGDRLDRMVQALEMAADDTMGTRTWHQRATPPIGTSCTAMRPERPARARPKRPRRGGTGSDPAGAIAPPRHTHSHRHRYARRSMAALISHHHHAQPAHTCQSSGRVPLTLPCGTVLWLLPGRAVVAPGPQPVRGRCALWQGSQLSPCGPARAHGHHGRQHRPAGCAAHHHRRTTAGVLGDFCMHAAARNPPCGSNCAHGGRGTRKSPWIWCWATTTATQAPRPPT